MRQRSNLTWFFAVLLSLLLAFPTPVPAQGQSAGLIARLVGSVNVQHGPRVALAFSGTKVFWGDLVTTLQDGRARISLDDGSILNVGSNSSLRIVQHDAKSQRTELQLAYGRLRASAIRLAQPNSSFQVRTPTAVAGVVGTEFVLTYENGISELSVIEGSVNFCNIAAPPKCVTVGAGYTSTIRGDNAPSQPTPTPPGTATEDIQSTSITGAGGAAVGAAGGTSVSVFAGIIGGLGALGGIIGVAVGNSTTKCGCTTVFPGGGVANNRHHP